MTFPFAETWMSTIISRSATESEMGRFDIGEYRSDMLYVSPYTVAHTKRHVVCVSLHSGTYKKTCCMCLPTEWHIQKDMLYVSPYTVAHTKRHVVCVSLHSGTYKKTCCMCLPTQWHIQKDMLYVFPYTVAHTKST